MLVLNNCVQQYACGRKIAPNIKKIENDNIAAFICCMLDPYLSVILKLTDLQDVAPLLVAARYKSYYFDIILSNKHKTPKSPC